MEDFNVIGDSKETEVKNTTILIDEAETANLVVNGEKQKLSKETTMRFFL